MGTGVQELKHAAKVQEWSARVAECRSSGIGVKAWCREHGIALKTYYNGKYNLKTVAQLGATVQAEVKAEDDSITTPADFVAVHYGDWPVPEIFVLNKNDD